MGTTHLLGSLFGSIAGAMVSQEVEAKSMNACEANKRVPTASIMLPPLLKSVVSSPFGCTEGFAQWFRDFDNVKIEVQQQVAESDRVVTQMVLRAVHREKHRNVSLATIRIDRMTDGKIAEHWSVADMAGLMNQLA